MRLANGVEGICEKLLKMWQVIGTRRAGALNYVLVGFVLLWLVYDRFSTC